MASPPLTPHQTPSAGDAPFTLALIVKRLNVLAAVLHEMEARVRNLERRCEASSAFEAAGLGARRNDAVAVTADPIAGDLAASVQSAAAPGKTLVTEATQCDENEFNGDVACHENDKALTKLVDISDTSRKGVCGETRSYRGCSASDNASNSATEVSELSSNLLFGALVSLDRDMSSLQTFSAGSGPRQPILPVTELRRRFEGALHPRHQFGIAQSKTWAFNTEGEERATTGEPTVAVQTKVHGVLDGDIMDPIPELKVSSLTDSPRLQGPHFAVADSESTKMIVKL
eukprot:TRINITY_DN15140_c0_g1_i3.p1 TRINITY_DN15140_c0_g1~~TRINITY_DN15140_c0_g1_i3.p1  ORF type:complete len:287 (+),score=42.62 TRINITY_DN15140_c0_g1_i3:102-962(+)